MRDRSDDPLHHVRTLLPRKEARVIRNSLLPRLVVLFDMTPASLIRPLRVMRLVFTILGEIPVRGNSLVDS